LKASGPLAVASASRAGEAPMLKIDRAQVKDWKVAVIFDNGALKSGPLSSIIQADELGVEIVREGAISVREMEKVAPDISMA
jgi:tRNA A37 threonylcarbamoyladenosine synthetase subunit TsaC/SUA5/YrdC